MSDAFLGDIKIVPFNFAPQGWALCNGQTMSISQNTALFSLLGTMYGGNGQTTFALPNLQARVPLHAGAGHIQGEQGGEVTHTLTIPEMPMHTHGVIATSDRGTAASPSNAVPATSAKAAYGTSPDTAMNPAAVSVVGGSQPHENMPPYLVLNFIICLSGMYPSRN